MPPWLVLLPECLPGQDPVPVVYPGVSAGPALPGLFLVWAVPPGLLLPVSVALPLLLPRQQCVLSLRIRVSGACLLPELHVWLSPPVWPASCPPQSSSRIGLPACPLTIIRPQPTEFVKGIAQNFAQNCIAGGVWTYNSEVSAVVSIFW